jgi:hypothetical protein
MSPLAKRVAKIEQASNMLPQKHLVWVEYDDDAAAVDDKIADLKACGRAKERDVFITVEWLQPTDTK